VCLVSLHLALSFAIPIAVWATPHANELAGPHAGNLIPGSAALQFDGATQWVTLRHWDMITRTQDGRVQL
jgi:hypothetical protein